MCKILIGEQLNLIMNMDSTSIACSLLRINILAAVISELGYTRNLNILMAKFVFFLS